MILCQNGSRCETLLPAATGNKSWEAKMKTITAVNNLLAEIDTGKVAAPHQELQLKESPTSADSERRTWTFRRCGPTAAAASTI
eukprot:7150345-Alexandrium_andersonii.AAC.1